MRANNRVVELNDKGDVVWEMMTEGYVRGVHTGLNWRDGLCCFRVVEWQGHLFRGAARVEVGLQQNLRRHAVAARLALLVRQARVPQGRLGFHRCETLVPEDHGQAR